MSALSSYPSETPATGDKMLGTDATDGGTHNFTVDALKTFYSAAPTFTGAVDLGTGGVTIGNADLAINTTAFSVDGSASKAAVGLGTGLGDGTLHVHTATAGVVVADALADDLIVESGGDCGISILSPAANSGNIIFGNPTDPDACRIRFQENNNELTIKIDAFDLMVFDGDTSNVGVGTASPDGTLHVHTATAGAVTADVSADDLVVENSGDSGVSILSGATSLGSILFGDSADSDVGRVVYSHSSDILSLVAGGGTVYVSINSDGDMYPNTTESQDLGSLAREWDNLFVQNAVTESDERKKEDIIDIENPLDFVNSLRPVQFKYKDTVIPEVPAVTYEAGEVIVAAKSAITDDEGNIVEPAVEEVIATGGEVKKDAIPESIVSHSRPHTGFIAQEVKAAMGDNDWAGYAYDEDADRHMLRLNEFIGYLVGAVKELTTRVVALEA